MDEITYNRERIQHWDKVARTLSSRRDLGAHYRRCLHSVYRFLIPRGESVLELGCGRGDLLAALEPRVGVGVDFSPEMTAGAAKRNPQLRFVTSSVSSYEPDQQFNFIILSDLVNDLWDVQDVFARLRSWCNYETRIILNTFNRVWQIPLTLARRIGWATPLLPQNWLTVHDIVNLLRLEDLELISQRAEILCPLRVPGVETALNRYAARMFPFQYGVLTHFLIARAPVAEVEEESRVTVVVAARNEEGNVDDIFRRVPAMGSGTELIFVEGGSTDNTHQAIEKAISQYPHVDARLYRQQGKGKGDAVRTGFERATGDVLMILDADLTVPPEDLPRFFQALVRGKAEYVNGVRLVYPMEQRAMRFMNFLGNKFFSLAFSWLLDRPIKDTLCGTKVLTRSKYNRIAANRGYFGEFDPFGDFDLIFGAAKLNLQFVDVPVRYRERTYGDTNISRWSHGWLLLRMVLFAMDKIKFIPISGRAKK